MIARGARARKLRIGTRGSTLARVQARWVGERLAQHGVDSEPVIIRTEGDDRPSETAWGEGAFVGRIVEALLREEVDLAVHSAKDVPTDEHPDLVIAAYPAREDARDALACRERGLTLETLPHGARVGTDSPRRRAFLHALRPDLELHPLHGNVDTRLRKLDAGETDALVLAVAGLTRLGRSDRVDQILPFDSVAPAPGQGALAVQVRAADQDAQALVAPLDDAATRTAVEAERTLLNATGGGCRSPIGAFGTADAEELELVAAAERTFTPAVDAPIALERVAWVRGRARPERRRELAAVLASRIVASRRRPRALVARAASQAHALLDALDAHGVDAVNVPTIEIESAPAGGPLDAALADLPQGAWIAVSSANAARAILDALARLRLRPRRFAWAAVGHTTAAALRHGGVDEVFVPGTATGWALAEELPLAPGQAVLLPQPDAADRSLAAALDDRGADTRRVLAYRTIEAPPASRLLLVQALEDGPVDAVVLTSGSTARGLLRLGSATLGARLRAIPVVAIGEPTARTARELGYRTVLVAPAPAASDLAAFTAEALGVNNGPSAREGAS